MQTKILKARLTRGGGQRKNLPHAGCLERFPATMDIHRWSFWDCERGGRPGATGAGLRVSIRVVHHESVCVGRNNSGRVSADNSAARSSNDECRSERGGRWSATGDVARFRAEGRSLSALRAKRGDDAGGTGTYASIAVAVLLMCVDPLAGRHTGCQFWTTTYLTISTSDLHTSELLHS